MMVSDQKRRISLLATQTGSIERTLLIGSLVVVACVVGAVYWLRGSPEPLAPVVLDPQVTAPAAPILRPLPPLPEIDATIAAQYQLEGDTPEMIDSDQVLRNQIRMLAGARPLAWLADEQLIEKIALQVANISGDGTLIYQHTPIASPEGGFAAQQLGDEWVVAPSSDQRYAEYAQFFSQLDTQLLVAFYSFYEPLLNEAYAAMGQSSHFRTDLLTTIDVILSTPIPEGPIQVEQDGELYTYADPAMEALLPAQKQLLRMGADNARLIQAALERFANTIRTR